MLKHLKPRKLLTIALTGAITIALALLFSTEAKAHTLSPYIKEYVIYSGEELDDSFSFTNTSDGRLNFNITVSAYDPKDGSFIDDDIFITPIEGNISLDAGETKLIKFKLDVPHFHEPGSFFNIVVVEEDLPLQENSVGFKTGFGLIAGVHIVEENGTIKGVFDSFSDVILSLTEKGLPYISPMVLKYSYTNNSNFIFLPEGEIRVYDKETNERILKDKLNPEDTKVFPKETYETNFSFDVWDYKNLFHDLKVVTRTYNQFDNNYIERVAVVPGFSEIPFVLAGGSIAVILIAVLVVLRGKKKDKPKREKKSKKRRSAAKEKEEKKTEE